MIYFRNILQILSIRHIRPYDLTHQLRGCKYLIKYLLLISPLYEKPLALILLPIPESSHIYVKCLLSHMRQRYADTVQEDFLSILDNDDVKNVTEMV